jgi:hypothetical protein
MRFNLLLPRAVQSFGQAWHWLARATKKPVTPTGVLVVLLVILVGAFTFDTVKVLSSASNTRHLVTRVRTLGIQNHTLAIDSHILALEAHALARRSLHETAAIRAAVQTSRYDSAFRSCKGVDLRHIQAVKLLHDAPAAEVELAEPLIDALAPYYANCVQYAATKTSLKVPTGDAPPKPRPEPSP